MFFSCLNSTNFPPKSKAHRSTSAFPAFLIKDNGFVEKVWRECYNISMTAIDEIRDKLKVLKGNRAIRKVILFGSYARGDVSRRSDVDLAVIMDTDKRFFDRYDLCGELYDLFDAGLDIFPYTEEEFSRISHRPFIKTIINEGVVVYES